MAGYIFITHNSVVVISICLHLDHNVTVITLLRETVKVTLFGDMGIQCQDSFEKLNRYPIIVILACAKVNRYEGKYINLNVVKCIHSTFMLFCFNLIF